jgi:hypothetical protein
VAGETPSAPSLDERRVLQLAHEFAARNHLPWMEPVQAEYFQRPAGPSWSVTTNWMGRDHSLHVMIDDRTKVIGTRSLLR